MKYKQGVSSDLLKMLIRYASGIGVDPKAVLRIAGLSSEILKETNAFMDADSFDAAWVAALDLSRDQNFGLHFGKVFPVMAGGTILFSVMQNCATVEESLTEFFRYHRLMTNLIKPRMEQVGNDIHCELENLHPGIEPQRHHVEATFSMLIHILRHLTGAMVSPSEVRFHHSRPENLMEHQEIFGRRILFSQSKNKLILKKEILSFPVLMANPEFLEILTHFAGNLAERFDGGDTWAGKVRETINRMLALGKRPEIETVARGLSVSVRGLQGKLKAEALTFRQIRDQVRKEFAVDCLKRGKLSLCEIAFLMAFSEQSSFHHAFKRWTGESPKNMRRKIFLNR